MIVKIKSKFSELVQSTFISKEKKLVKLVLNYRSVFAT